LALVISAVIFPCSIEALRPDPEGAEAHYNLAAALRDKGDLDGAIREYREALRLNPNNPRVQDALNEALKKSH
jgi:Flp pilus assembly protein TadD